MDVTAIRVTDTNDYKSLFFEQKLAFHAALAGKNMLITGGGGVGKSHLIKAIERHHRNIVLCASTGIAGLNIGGVTLDSFMGFYGEFTGKNQNRSLPPKLKEKLSNLKCLLIDEASMTRIDKFNDVNSRLQDAKENKKPFGGVQIIIVADFCQLKPVIGKNKTEAMLLRKEYGQALYAFESESYKIGNFIPFVLTNYERQAGEPEQQKTLKNIRMGNRLPQSVEAVNRLAKGVINESSVYLCTTNKQADSINMEKYRNLNAREKAYYGRAHGEVSIKPVKDSLLLKIGCRVMVATNNEEENYFNGDLGVVTELNRDSVRVNLDRGFSVDVKKHEWKEYDYISSENSLKKKEIGKYEQVPLKLAYAITIHKSQGMTLEHVVLDLTAGVFTESMAYVGLSRVRSFSNLVLIKPLKVNDITVNSKAKDFTMMVSLEALKRQLSDAELYGVNIPEKKKKTESA